MFYLIICLIIGLVCAGFAIKKGQNAAVWFFLGVLLGPIGLICAMFSPRATKASEETHSQAADE